MRSSLPSFLCALCFDFCYHKFIGRRHEENGEDKKVPEMELKQGNFDDWNFTIGAASV